MTGLFVFIVWLICVVLFMVAVDGIYTQLKRIADALERK